MRVQVLGASDAEADSNDAPGRSMHVKVVEEAPALMQGTPELRDLRRLNIAMHVH